MSAQNRLGLPFADAVVAATANDGMIRDPRHLPIMIQMNYNLYWKVEAGVMNSIASFSSSPPSGCVHQPRSTTAKANLVNITGSGFLYFLCSATSAGTVTFDIKVDGKSYSIAAALTNAQELCMGAMLPLGSIDVATGDSTSYH
jgi:hypothetical protein